MLSECYIAVSSRVSKTAASQGRIVEIVTLNMFPALGENLLYLSELQLAVHDI
jgi:hypothetical protein